MIIANKWILWGCILILPIFNAILMYQNRALKARSARSIVPFSEFLGVAKLPAVSLLDRNGAIIPLRHLISGHPVTLLIFFSPSDCAPCFDERNIWPLVEKRGYAAVYGVASSSDPGELWRWIDNNDIPVPVYVDTSFACADTMALIVTPLKILVDSTGKIMWADPPRESGGPRDLFWEDLKYVLGKQ